ncbi:MAG: carboxymuconolactone decarboxylase family protein, partial [Actinomycetes bacterium]
MSTDDERYAEGMRIRREVLGHDHVDGAQAAADDFTRDFQEFITRYAWGTVWAREGIGRRERSLITLALLAGLGR